MLSIYYHHQELRFYLGDAIWGVKIQDFKDAFKSVGAFLEDIIYIELIHKLEIHIDYLDRLDFNFGIDLSLFTGCKELVIHSRIKDTGINYNNLPQNLEKLIIKYDTFREDIPLIELTNLPYQINYLVLSGIIVESLDYLPITLIDISFYEVYINNGDCFDLSPNVKNFLCTYTSRNFKVGKEIKNVIHNNGRIRPKKEYLEGGKIKKF